VTASTSTLEHRRTTRCGRAVPNIGTALAAIRRIDAQNRLLSDPRLPGAFAEQDASRAAGGKCESRTGSRHGRVGVRFGRYPRSPICGTRCGVPVGTQQLVARRQSLESSLAALLWGRRPHLRMLMEKRAELEELRSIAPDSQVLKWRATTHTARCEHPDSAARGFRVSTRRRSSSSPVIGRPPAGSRSSIKQRQKNSLLCGARLEAQQAACRADRGAH